MEQTSDEQQDGPAAEIVAKIKEKYNHLFMHSHRLSGSLTSKLVDQLLSRPGIKFDKHDSAIVSPRHAEGCSIANYKLAHAT